MSPAEWRAKFAAQGRLKTYLQTGGTTPPVCDSPDDRPRGGVHFGAQSQLFQGALDDRSLKPSPVSLRDFGKELTNPSWRAQLSHSRRLFANLGAVRGAVCERARLAVGQAWKPVYAGRNEKWGKKAVAWLNQWMQVCDVRGFPYDFRTNLRLMSIALDRDGDFTVNLVNKQGAWPQIQLIPAHRIATRTMTNDSLVPTGPYKGCYINNGVISNDAGCTLAMNVLGPQRGLDLGVSRDRQLSTFDAILHYRPDWMEQGRGLSSFSSALKDWRHMSDLRDLEFQAAAVQGTETIIVANETGEAEDGDLLGEDEDEISSGLSMETLAGGTIRYVRAGTGADAKGFTTTRPSPAWIGLMDHLERGCFAALGWPKEYALDMKELGGATVRAVLDKCQYSIDERQADLGPVAMRIICWAISVAIEEGILEDDEDWYLWEFLLPGELSVDDGRDRSNDRDDMRAGLTNKRRIYGRRGLDWVTETDQREKEVDDLLTRAERVAKAHPTYAPQVVLNMLESNTPNGVQVTEAVEPADAKPTTTPAKKAA